MIPAGVIEESGFSFNLESMVQDQSMSRKEKLTRYIKQQVEETKRWNVSMKFPQLGADPEFDSFLSDIGYHGFPRKRNFVIQDLDRVQNNAGRRAAVVFLKERESLFDEYETALGDKTVLSTVLRKQLTL